MGLGLSEELSHPGSSIHLLQVNPEEAQQTEVRTLAAMMIDEQNTAQYSGARKEVRNLHDSIIKTSLSFIYIHDIAKKLSLYMYWSRVIPYGIGTSFHPTPSDFAINGVYCRVLIVRKLCQVSLSYLEPFPRKSVRRLTFTDLRGLAEIATS